jgi:hypothetical protein
VLTPIGSVVTLLVDGVSLQSALNVVIVTVVARPLFTLEMLLVEMPVDMLAPI